MGFQQGLSGLNAASKSLDAIGNNVANANTVGFKAAQAQFADVYASSLTGAGASQLGIGTKVSQVAQQFSQGNVTASNNPLDIAINGGGFFRMSNNGSITYGRNGQFQLDKNGYIVNATGSRLTGFPANAQGALSTGAPTDLNINTADLPPAATVKVAAILNLDSSEPVPATTTFSLTDPTSYNKATSVSVFDSLGNSHVLQTFYVKTGTTGQWDVYAAADNTLLTTTAGAGKIGTLAFGTDGMLDSTTLGAMPFDAPIPALQGAAAFTPKFDYTGTTQFGSAFSVNTLNQDGYASGRLSAFNAGADGIITGRYTNGKSAVLGQVVLANFTNPNGLQPLGNNVWAETSASGAALVGAPSTGSLGVLQSSAVEDSNVDLTAELVNMITAQRVYQANAQTIKTQDQVLQTLVNLR
ncbi:MAG: flgE [Herminiimonas sp.]|nr:flgE [Herminiimonas sp.]